jgi:hypothetical protein
VGEAWLFPVHRLEADGYSVPRGSHGIVEKWWSSDAGRAAWVSWLPPASGSSGPILEEHLAETHTPLVIDKKWVQDA